MVPQHSSFSLHTMLEGPRLHNMAFPTPMVRPLDESQGSSPLQGHGSWLMCEVALRAALHLEAEPIRCVRGLKSSIVIGQKVEINPNPFTHGGRADLVV